MARRDASSYAVIGAGVNGAEAARMLVSALRHLPATRVAIISMLEPVLATAAAWAWLGESLGAAQLVGAAIVLAAILLAQTAR